MENENLEGSNLPIDYPTIKIIKVEMFDEYEIGRKIKEYMEERRRRSLVKMGSIRLKEGDIDREEIKDGIEKYVRERQLVIEAEIYEELTPTHITRHIVSRCHGGKIEESCELRPNITPWLGPEGMDYIKEKFEQLKELEGGVVRTKVLRQINPFRSGIGYFTGEDENKMNICLTTDVNYGKLFGPAEVAGPVIGSITYEPVF